jgi:hypothetical protein
MNNNLNPPCRLEVSICNMGVALHIQEITQVRDMMLISMQCELTVLLHKFSIS